MTKKKARLGLTRDLYCAPLFHGLTGEEAFDCTFDVVARNAARMRAHELDGAFLSPIDYARESSDYCIIKDVAASSRAATDTVALHFKEGLHTITTLAVHPTSTSEIVLASIILNERFDVRPTIVPMMGSLDQMLQKANAALLVGNTAMEEADRHHNQIDLVEEWVDMTGLPYIHGFWCVRETDVNPEGVAAIQRAGKAGVERLSEEIKASVEEGHLSPLTQRQYLQSFSFTFSEEEQQAVSEFIRYAYYHGSLPDVADLHFYPDEHEDPLPLNPLSLN